MLSRLRVIFAPAVLYKVTLDGREFFFDCSAEASFFCKFKQIDARTTKVPLRALMLYTAVSMNDSQIVCIQWHTSSADFLRQHTDGSCIVRASTAEEIMSFGVSSAAHLDTRFSLPYKDWRLSPLFVSKG